MQQAIESRLAENILLFARTLRSAGIPIGTSQIIDAIEAAQQTGIDRRDDLYFALRSVLIKHPAQFRLFGQTFHLYFKNPRLLERMMALMLPSVVDPSAQTNTEPAMRRLMDALETESPAQDGEFEPLFDRSDSYSSKEILRDKDFEQMSLQEIEDARSLLLRDIPFLRKHVGRRFQAHARGDRIDLRRSMRLMHRHGGGFIPLARKRRVPRSPDLVILADISGSMSIYTRMFLHLAWLLTRRESVVHTFVFGTRLSNISVKLQGADVDSAMAAVAASVVDWDGGTQIANSLAEFNRDWSRRVLARDSIVLLLSDGLEREADSDLEFQMRRLQRSCRRLVWMNPMLRYSEFEPKALGIRKMLSHVDAFVPAHNVNSLTEVLDCLNAPPQHGSGTRKYPWARNS